MPALTTTEIADLSALARDTRLPVMSRAALRVAFLALLWSQRRRTRMHLRDLDPALLKDVGLSPDDARLEGAKPFWRP
ncbi:MAG: DUF1127 domain-containing protein [Roseovarius sp.]